ncbi:MAG: hypothetical protein AAB568_02285 [Patescibacteria group bacterium]
MNTLYVGLTYAVLLIVATAIYFAAIVIIRKIYLRRQTKKVVVPESQTKQLDMDKIAKGLGAERGGEIPAKGGYFGALQTAASRPVPPTIIQATEDFQIKLEDALAIAGLPADTKKIIGQMFQFQAKLPRSVHLLTVIGTITGLEISNLDKGVNLFLSARQFNGVKIERLHIEYNEHLNERDYALILKDGSAIPGQFRLM